MPRHRTSDALPRPHVAFVALVAGVVFMACTVFAGFLSWQLFQLGGRDTCPDGMCVLWMYFGLLGGGPAFVLCALAAGIAARCAAKSRHATQKHVWEIALLTASLTWFIAAALGLAGLHAESSGLPPGPEELIERWFR